ncbi:MAG TPA: AAA family ATPase [Candidatus Dormibacteraeota bacterium]
MAVVRALCPVLVGRERELTDLEDALLAAMGGEGRLVLLTGDAGMGKTRLATEIGDRASGIGATVLNGGCSEADLALPYLPFLEALGNYVAQVDLKALRHQLGDSAAELGNLFPRLGRGVPSESGEPAQAKLRFFEAILHLLEVIAGDSGLLLVVEDLHRADASTRELLDYLARRLLPARVLVLGTYRTEEIGRMHPLLANIQGWRRSGLAQLVELKPLDADAVAGMVEAILDAPLHADTGVFLHERCEGNPFVLEEFLKESIDRGDIFRTDRGWERKELNEFRLPETVRETILLRLDRLAVDQVRMLRAASVLGDSFHESTLMAVADQDLATIQEALRACIQQQLVQERADSTAHYRFRHALTREAVYEDLVSTERQEFHGRAADALGGRPGSSAVDIANHLFAAGRPEEAVPLCLEAARQAQETWAVVDAAELYETALPHVHDPLPRAEVLQRLGTCLSHADRRGAAGAAERYLQEAVSILDREGEATAAARVRVALAQAMYPRMRHTEAERELVLAATVLEPLGPSADLAEAYNLLSFFRVVQFDGPGCLEWGEKALSAAEAAHASVAQVRAQNLFGLGLACEGRTDEAIEWLDRSAAEAVRHNWSWYSLSAMNNTFLFLPLERWAEAPARLDRMDAVDPKNFTTLTCHAWAWVVRGFPAKAAEMAESARRSSASRELAISVFWTNCTLVIAYAWAGRLDDARRALPPADASTHKQDQLSRWGAELQLAVVGGDSGGAVAGARPVPNLVSGWPWALERVLALQALVDLGAVEEVDADLQAAPDTAFFRGVRIDLAGAKGDHAAVLASAPDFIRLADRVEARLFADRARLALAQARAESGEREAAAALLQDVMASAIEREHHRQQYQTRLLAAKLGIELSEELPQVTAEEPTAIGERFVTVLFADVRGYTAMTQQVAPAVMAEKIGSFQRSAAREVARQHGTIDKFAGDAVMATFNVGGASVDHASHALRTAVAMRDRARYLGLALGIGIATGPAIVGRLSAGGNVSVLGETTNLASRLQAQAGPDEIVLNEVAWRRLREQVEARHEMLELKGFAHPVGAYRVH